jgi:hypothetical protein
VYTQRIFQGKRMRNLALLFIFAITSTAVVAQELPEFVYCANVSTVVVNNMVLNKKDAGERLQKGCDKSNPAIARSPYVRTTGKDAKRDFAFKIEGDTLHIVIFYD